MHGLLEKVLEDTQNVSVPWVISHSDLAPPSIFLVAPAPDGASAASRSNPRSGSGNVSRASGGIRSVGNNTGRFGSNAATAAGAHSSAGGGAPDLSPPTLKGASGALPSELALRGRWFARTVGDGAILLTFLPALDVWRKEVSARLERRRALREAAAERKRKSKVRLSASSSKSSSPSSLTSPPAITTSGGAGIGVRRRQKEEKQQQQQQQHSKNKEQVSSGRDEDEDDSLGLFLFLVRSGDFGLPIEPQSAKLRGIRRILLAHIPRSHHQAMAFKPVRR